MIFFYRYFLSPLVHLLSGPGMGCRFDPTCSHYFEEAVKIHGWRRGSRMGVARILRCRPGSRAPYFDPVLALSPPCDKGNPPR